jgi:hypothetical protein
VKVDFYLPPNREALTLQLTLPLTSSLSPWIPSERTLFTRLTILDHRGIVLSAMAFRRWRQASHSTREIVPGSIYARMTLSNQGSRAAPQLGLPDGKKSWLTPLFHIAARFIRGIAIIWAT